MPGPRTAAGDNLHQMKYRQPNEDFREAVNRWSFGLKDSDDHYYALRGILGAMRFLLPGRAQSAIGAMRETTAHNCFVSATISDSFVHGTDSIMDVAKLAAATMRMGGGIGYDFSTLRPRGDAIRRLQSISSGPVSFMSIFNQVGLCTASSGHRRGAQMGVLRVDHPDIIEYIGAKQPTDSQRALWKIVQELPEDHPSRELAEAALQELLPLQGFNISVGVTDEFMECVYLGRDFDLRFNGQVYRTVDARELWEKIMRSTWDWSEPGVLFLDRINTMNNLWYAEVISATNPCVPAGTPILTKEGWKPIESLVGQSVSVWNGYEWSETEPRPTGVDQPLVTVKLSNGTTLTCTEAHKFILADGKRIEAIDLIVGDQLLEGEWPVIDSGEDNELAYTQGFYSGDGWTETTRKRSFISFKKIEKKRCEPYLVFERSYDCANDYRMLYLTKLVDVDKTFVPGTEWSVRSRLDWLAGLFDSDGTLAWSHDTDGKNSSCAIQVCSVEKEFIYKTALLLQTLGVKPVLSSTEHREKSGGFENGRPVYYLQVRASEATKLVSLGLITHRLDLSENYPARSAARKLRVLSVKPAGIAPVVFCFTESVRNLGCFNGVLTGQCGEQPLPPHGACLLGSFNLVQYLSPVGGVRAPETPAWSFDYDLLTADIPIIVRAMDNILDRSRYPVAQQKAEALMKRRMGLGITGLANAGEAQGLSYGSPAFVEFTKRVLTIIRNETYRASALLAKEKEPFPLYDEERYPEGKFIKTLPDDIQSLIRKNGIRNSHLTSIAPTGTISMCADNVSSGLEPVLYHTAERNINTPTGSQRVTIEDYGTAFLGVRGRLSEEVAPEEHIAVLCAAQELVDSAVSKTVNVDKKTSWASFKELYAMGHRGGAKGLTTYNKDGKRGSIIRAASSGSDSEDGDSCEVDPATGRRNCA